MAFVSARHGHETYHVLNSAKRAAVLDARSIEVDTSILAVLIAGRTTNPEAGLTVSVSLANAVIRSVVQVSGPLFLHAVICDRPYLPLITTRISPSHGV